MSLRHFPWLVRAALASVVGLCLTSRSSAQAPAANFAGKQITVAVASTPGGGYDSYARLLASHIGKYLAGNPNAITSNMTGAGGNTLARYINSVAPKDGTWIALVLPATITGGIYIDKSKLQYDPSQLVHIGSANSEIDMCFVRSNTGVTKLSDALAREVTMGASAVGGATREQPLVLNRMLGAKFKIISGYPGTREILLAIERDEVSGVCGMSYSSMRMQKGEWLENGFIRAISQNHPSGDKTLTAQGVQRAVEFAKSDIDLQAMELIYSQQIFGRPFVVAAGMSPGVVTALRSAFMKAMNDGQLKADAHKMGLDINPVAGDELQKIVDRLYASPASVIARAADALKAEP